MASVLGNKQCIESLQLDVGDIQSTIDAIVDKVGTQHCMSWKYPDKLAGDLNLDQILDLYSYDDTDEEANQMAHAILLELIIDRFIYMLRCLSQYGSTAIGGDDATHRSSNTIGVQVRQFWLRLQKLVSRSDNSAVSSARDPQTSRDTSRLTSSPSPSTGTARDRAKPRAGGSSRKSNPAVPPLPLASTRGINADLPDKDDVIQTPKFVRTTAISTQTVETAFVPCDACANVQATLRSDSEALVRACQAHNISSKLSKLLPTMEWECVTSSDLSRWQRDHAHDMAAFSKHVEWLRDTLGPLKEALGQARSEEKKAREIAQTCKRDVAAVEAQSREAVSDARTALSVAEARRDADCGTLRDSLKEMTRAYSELQARADALASELAAAKSLSRKMEKEVASLKESETNLRRDMSSTEQHFEATSSELSTLKSELLHQKTQYSSLQLNFEQLQEKQTRLLDQLEAVQVTNEDELDRLADEKDELGEARRRLEEEFSEARRSLEEEVQRVTERLRSLQEGTDVKIKELEQEGVKLRGELSAARDREQLLTNYPDLTAAPAMPEESGDICVDIQRQIGANELRARLLTEQNTRLTSSLRKLRQTQLVGGDDAALEGKTRPPSAGGSRKLNSTLPPPSPSQYSNSGQPKPFSVTSKVEADSLYNWSTPKSTPKDVPVPLWESKINGNSKEASENTALKSLRARSNSWGSSPRGGAGDGRTSSASRHGDTIATMASTRQAALQSCVKFKNSPLLNHVAADEKAPRPMIKGLYELHSCGKCGKTYGSTKDMQIHNLYCK